MPNLANRYQLAEIIYSDAHVVAHRAQDQLLNRTVTIELLQPGRGDEPQRIARLLAKARQAALTNLPHVAPLYDQHTVNELPFLVLEEPIGPSLAEAAPLPPAQLVALVCAVAETLRVAQARQQPQPTINPFTVRIGPDARVQILDLGLDQLSSNQTAAVQRLGQLISAALSSTSDRQSAPFRRIAEGAANGAYASIDALLAALQQIEQRAEQPTTVLPRVMPTIDMREEQLDAATVVVAPQVPPAQPVQPAQPGRRLWETAAAQPGRRLWETAAAQPRWRLWAGLGAGLLALLLLGSLLTRPNAETAQQPAASAPAGATTSSPAASPAANPANGTLFTVATNGGQSLIVRSGPGRSFSRITSIPNGSTVEVLEGPQAADGFNWVRIRTANVEGWCVSEALRRR